MTDPEAIRGNIEKIEEAYEYMLAYAAQGRSDEGAGPDGAQIREFLRQFAAALEAIIGQVDGLPQADNGAAGFLRSLRQDSETVGSILAILLERENISSQVIDNTNGLISIRSYLTNLFFLDKCALP